MSKRVILITGANKGIGFEVVKKLVAKPSNDVILLGCRDLQRGENALKALGSPSNVHLLHIDTSSPESIDKAKKEVQEKYNGQLDILVNNAGIADMAKSIEVARKIFATNYFGAKLVAERFADLIRENGRIINVASEVGAWTLFDMSKELQEKYQAKDLTKEKLNQLVDEFLSSVETDRSAELGYGTKFPYLIYGASKAALIALTKVEAREWKGANNVLVLAVCPGYCSTDLNHHGPGSRSPELGADSLLHTINTPANQLENGEFYQDGQKKPQKYASTMDVSKLADHVNAKK